VQKYVLFIPDGAYFLIIILSIKYIEHETELLEMCSNAFSINGNNVINLIGNKLSSSNV